MGCRSTELWSTTGLSARRVRINGAVQLFRMRTLGRIDLTGLAAQSLHLWDTYVKEDIELEKCVIQQSVDFQDVRAGSQALVRTSRLIRALGLYGAVIKYNSVGFGCHPDGRSFGKLPAGRNRFQSWGGTPLRTRLAVRLSSGEPSSRRVANPQYSCGKSIEAKGVATGEVRILGGHLQSERPKAAVENSELPTSEASLT